jgi:phage head maturation protease
VEHAQRGCARTLCARPSHAGHALMRAGALDGLSIGFRTVKGRRDRATGWTRSTCGRSRW